MEAAMRGMLDPEYEEKVVGQLEIRQILLKLRNQWKLIPLKEKREKII